MKRKIVISAINLFEGGTLSVLKDCLYSIENNDQFNNDEFIALVHKKSLFEKEEYKKINFIEFPDSRKSYLYRLYYEFFYFKKFAKINKVDFWISLHDISPNIGNVPQVVYCHNSTPFNKVKLKDLIIQPTIFFFSLFYSYLYSINIKKNKFVIVQQLWIKNEFHNKFGLELNKIIIAKPQEPIISIVNNQLKLYDRKVQFVFPTFPRVFKNIEIIAEAVIVLNNQGINKFIVNLTIDGTENKYSKLIYKKYSYLECLNFIGLQTREKVYELYGESNCLLFPSKLETWGLPISEYKQFDKPIIVANLPYAKETVAQYDKAKFFNPNSSISLANCMKEIILNKDISFDKTEEILYPQPYVENWESLIQLILN